MNTTILLVDDDQAVQFGFSNFFKKSGYLIDSADTLEKAKQKFSNKRYDIILLDLKLPDGNGINWIPQIKSTDPEIAVVIITGAGDIPQTVTAMRNGADHFLTKPIKLEDLEIFLKKKLEIDNLKKKDEAYLRTKKKTSVFFGNSSVMQNVKKYADMAAKSDSVILIQGSTGTGKGVLAKWLHGNSPKCNQPFVSVNCASLKGDLLNSELFGHVKGAFTSAVQDKKGLIEIANGGTLFLDEIGDMDLSVQTQFLKTLEEKTFRRVGDTRERKSDFRLICATNHDLEKDVKAGNFRKDLYYRICVFPIVLPDLKYRTDDIEGLIKEIFISFKKPLPEISSKVFELFEKYSWPGNIRELKNMLERALILSSGNTITTDHFPGFLENKFSENTSNHTKLEDIEKKHIQNVLSQNNGDTVKSSGLLGISRASLYRKINKYNISI